MYLVSIHGHGQNFMMLAFLRMRFAVIYVVYVSLFLTRLHSRFISFSLFFVSFTSYKIVLCIFGCIFFSAHREYSSWIQSILSIFFKFSGFNIKIYTINYAMSNDLHDLTALCWFIDFSSTEKNSKYASTILAVTRS